MKLFLIVLLSFSSVCTADSVVDIEAAERLFERYVTLQSTFDSSIAELYCDEGIVRIEQLSKDGASKTLEGSAAVWKKIVAETMPEAREMSDYSSYSELRFQPEGDAVRVTALRYSMARKYSGPSSMLIGACSAGNIGIQEQTSQLRDKSFEEQPQR